MMESCANIQERLGAWLDGELNPAEGERVELHLKQCPVCVGEKSRIERLDSALKNTLEAEAATVPFAPFWAGVHARIVEERSWQVRVVDWFRLTLTPPRLAWAIPAVIVLLLGVLSLERFVPGLGFGQTNLASVESIDGHGMNVALLRESQTKTTVIWLFEDHEGETESAAEPASADPAF
jgi:anti-sigma factor RsiW